MLFISAICLEANGYASTAWQQPQHTQQPVRRTPTPERQRLIERVTPRPPTVEEDSAGEADPATDEPHRVIEDDEPPSYDSCRKFCLF